ncbi:hypothetical protein MJG53_008255 [Ovis ammon polii x Ovis aries]|uniref:Uncharacterized protein n=1 Tax=Ovis ammon polii x Ovis aries TaxID=2918886 RepID=A0ACB9UZZ9_9CETA|nr:hypothetical protein MJG53_008255 [Ovis ammon polii x Ovis aries]
MEIPKLEVTKQTLDFLNSDLEKDLQRMDEANQVLLKKIQEKEETIQSLERDITLSVRQAREREELNHFISKKEEALRDLELETAKLEKNKEILSRSVVEVQKEVKLQKSTESCASQEKELVKIESDYQSVYQLCEDQAHYIKMQSPEQLCPNSETGVNSDGDNPKQYVLKLYNPSSVVLWTKCFLTMAGKILVTQVCDTSWRRSSLPIASELLATEQRLRAPAATSFLPSEVQPGRSRDSADDLGQNCVRNKAATLENFLSLVHIQKALQIILLKAHKSAENRIHLQNWHPSCPHLPTSLSPFISVSAVASSTFPCRGSAGLLKPLFATYHSSNKCDKSTSHVIGDIILVLRSLSGLSYAGSDFFKALKTKVNFTFHDDVKTQNSMIP